MPVLMISTYNEDGTINVINTAWGTMTMQEFEYGQPQNLKNNEFTNPNGIFMKWNTKADGTGTDYKE